ncbi:MAG: NAD-dependent malic enzyme [Cyanobacteria bacterium]|jgi:malate dehydrogenase (oxaloacetate-decarboxylating)|nr:NAD-dependent malic enzyme [Cyanobacteria bacterium CG_2015-16_32_12]NCO79049.1 NAD-dependent malic enzyme [Cyanobacteria bacterium CG_2015-22_32_23]NCQ03836.1 NAD-dependent malic enzyme [Cyanobacteria bacterium CG_2015-09_32_10]NCQ40517.1 NAD-dependent malic enzyme [Cyanobacteria bacterium CG_2015-04_32_10]NCS84419.1 NAD-dependent malic enzyme [Cyanobacteria bacterium CG_2015-02_32_10]
MADLTPNSSFSLTVRLELLNRAGTLAKVTKAIAEVGGSLGQVSLIERNLKTIKRELTIDAFSTEHAEKIVAAIKSVAEVNILNVSDRTFDIHRGGKIHIQSRIQITSSSDLAMAYTPGVGRICKAIHEDPENVYSLTIKSNSVAIVTDGSAVLGLGNLGPEAALPVMEGKSMLFKEFGDIDAFPVCLATQDVEEIIKTVKNIAPVFGGINLEDIAAPRCFEIEKRLQEELDIPIFHDDQHGTAIVSTAALINALKVVKKEIETIRVVINGAGAAGIAIARLLNKANCSHITICDSKGIISKDRENLTNEKQFFAVEKGGLLKDALIDADVFIGVSAPKILTPEMVKTMAKDPIIFAMANPTPEIQPELIQDIAAVIATGRSDYPNQINNVLAFPGLFRGALDCRATALTTEMYLQAAKAIASLVSPNVLDKEHIIPSVFDNRVATTVSAAVQQAAREAGVAKL